MEKHEQTEVKERKTKLKTMQGAAQQYRALFMFLSFFVPLEMMFLVFARSIVYPFGDETFLNSDLYAQYMPLFQEFVHKIRAGESFFYSWNVGMGTNFYAVFGYYLASPLHWLAFLVPDAYLVEFVSYLVVLKVGLAGLTAFVYLENRSKEEKTIRASYIALFFSFGYAMSSYIAAYSYNIMWLDCVILAPLILMGLERLVKEGKIGVYVISLAICIYSNFYISYMICIFVVIYFVFLFLTENREKHTFWRFFYASLLAGGIASVMLIPIAKALLGSGMERASFPKKWSFYFSVFKMLARHCILIETPDAKSPWPNVYCGTAVFLFLPLYFMNKGIAWKKKIGSLLLIAILLLSFMTDGLDYIWHGMNYPNGFSARQSFLYILLILSLGYDCMIKAKCLNAKAVWKSYAGAAVFLVLTKFFFQSTDFHRWDWLITLVFVSGYALCLTIYYFKSSPKALERLAVILYILVILDGTLNMSETGVLTMNRSGYFAYMDEYKTLYERNKGEEGFQRFESINDRLDNNNSTHYGFPSASVFSSILNTNVGNFYAKMGMKHSRVFQNFSGATPFVAALMNVNYWFAYADNIGNEFRELTDYENGVCLYQAQYRLPFGYVAPAGFDLNQNGDAIILQQNLANNLGVKTPLFHMVETSDEKNSTIFVTEQEGRYYAVLNQGMSLNLFVKTEDADMGGYNKNLYRNNVIELGKLMAGQKVFLYEKGNDGNAKPVLVNVYCIDEQSLKEAIENLGRNHMTEVLVKDLTVSGHLELEEPGRLITSVPCDPGWTVYVNGEITKAQSFGDAFIALDLGPGSYEIEMHFFPEGLKLGIIVSFVSLLLFAGCICFVKQKGKLCKINEKHNEND